MNKYIFTWPTGEKTEVRALQIKDAYAEVAELLEKHKEIIETEVIPLEVDILSEEELKRLDDRIENIKMARTLGHQLEVSMISLPPLPFEYKVESLLGKGTKIGEGKILLETWIKEHPFAEIISIGFTGGYHYPIEILIVYNEG